MKIIFTWNELVQLVRELRLGPAPTTTVNKFDPQYDEQCLIEALRRYDRTRTNQKD